MSAETTQKYFTVAFIDGVACRPSCGSCSGAAISASAAALFRAFQNTSMPMPSSSTMTLKPVHSSRLPSGLLPTISSGGQLLV